MDLSSKTVIKNLFKKQKIKPSKRLGQTFLIDKKTIKKFIGKAKLQSKDIILEIGPGVGVLTEKLAKKTKKVIAIEKDRKICKILRETLKDIPNVEIINEDILKYNFQFSIFNFQSIPNFQFSKNYKVIANLPFYITAPTIRMFLESRTPPKEMVLIIQKEVAQRICAKPRPHPAGSGKYCGQAPKMNLLAVSVQFYAKVKIIGYISKKSFWPKPKVDSAIIKISAFNQRRKSAFNQRFFEIVKAGFSHPRKQLANNLSKELALSLPNGVKLNKEQINSWLKKNNIQPNQRAETLTIKNWIKLTNMLNPVRD